MRRHPLCQCVPCRLLHPKRPQRQNSHPLSDPEAPPFRLGQRAIASKSDPIHSPLHLLYAHRTSSQSHPEADLNLLPLHLSLRSIAPSTSSADPYTQIAFVVPVDCSRQQYLSSINYREQPIARCFSHQQQSGQSHHRALLAVLH